MYSQAAIGLSGMGKFVWYENNAGLIETNKGIENRDEASIPYYGSG